MTTFAKSVGVAAQGGTADTFDTVGTVTLSNKATHVHGLLINWAAAVRTAAEAHACQLRWSSADNGIGNQTMTVHGNTGGAPATNIQAVGQKQTLLSLDLPVSGNSKFDFEVSSHAPDPTGTIDVGVSVLYSDGNKGDMRNWWPFPIPGIGSDTEALAAATATTDTAITNLEVPGWADVITGFYIAVVPDAAITAADPILPIVTFRSSFENFDPQEYIGPSIHGYLGTAVGSGVDSPPGWIIPTYIPTNSNANGTITPYVKFLTTSATNIAVSADVFFK